MTGHPHSIINVDEGPAYGVALLAAVGTGVFDSVEDACAQTISTVDTPQVNAGNHRLYSGYHRLYRSLYGQLRGAFDAAAELVEESGV